MTDMKDWDQGFSTDENMDDDIIELTDIIEPDLDDTDDEPIIELTDIIKHAPGQSDQDLADQDLADRDLTDRDLTDPDLELNLEGVDGSDLELENDSDPQEDKTGDFQELELELDNSDMEGDAADETVVDEAPVEGIELVEDELEMDGDFDSLDTDDDPVMDDGFDQDSYDQMDDSEEDGIAFDGLEMDIDDDDDSFEDATYDADPDEKYETGEEYEMTEEYAMDADADDEMDSVDIDLNTVEYQAETEQEESGPEMTAVPLPVTDSPGVSISDEQLDAALERVIEKKFADKIEVVLLEVMQQVIEKEISQIKKTLQEDLDQIGTA